MRAGRSIASTPPSLPRSPRSAQTSHLRSTKRHTQSADGSEHRSQQSRWFGLASEQRAGVQVQPEGVVVSLAFALELAHGAAIDARCPQDLAAAVIAFDREVACLRPAEHSVSWSAQATGWPKGVRRTAPDAQPPTSSTSQIDTAPARSSCRQVVLPPRRPQHSLKLAP
eukprot:COSAG04_NODE_9604_length_848_cov_1.181575_1_plen_168_part_10